MRKHALESYINEVYFWQQNEESYLRLDMLNALSFMYQPKGNIFGWILKEIRCSGSQPKAGVATAGFVCKETAKKCHLWIQSLLPPRFCWCESFVRRLMTGIWLPESNTEVKKQPSSRRAPHPAEQSTDFVKQFLPLHHFIAILNKQQ